MDMRSAQARASAAQRAREPSPSTSDADDTSVSIDVTTELRWFFDEPLPTEVFEWFSPADMVGFIEHRYDSYRIDDQVDVGVKRRHGSTLELKSRQAPPESFAVGAGSVGQLESWKRWSPADRHVEIDDDTQWVDVEKAVIRRRFDAEGQEASLSETTRGMIGEGCDAEVVAVSVENRPAWSVAFTAFGLGADHRPLVLAAAEALLGDEPDRWRERLDAGMSCGYPEWLARSRQDSDT